ncbi:PD-(D/E)XK motif protein [Lutibacter sp.]
MIDLKEIYDNLPLPKGNNLHSYSAKAIEGFENHRIGKNYLNNPSLLIFISEQDKDFYVANQNLFNLKVSHNLKCEVVLENKNIYNNFSVVTYTGQDSDIKDLFLKTSQILIQSLGRNPSNKKIKFIVGKFIELFKSLKEVPKKSLQGLWAELFVIEQSKSPEKLIAGWYSIPEERFDFSFGDLRLEVKSANSEIRKHFFSSAQLNPIGDIRIVIASILVNRNVGGVSLKEIIEKLNIKLSSYPKQMEKLHLTVYSVIGSDIDKINEVRFDYSLAKETYKLYNSTEIPKIESISIPKEVTNVKFVSNLINSRSIEITTDELIKPYLK